MKLSKEALRFALKALRDIGATADEIIPVRAAGTADDVMRVAAQAAGRIKPNVLTKNIATFMRGETPVAGIISDVDKKLFTQAARNVRNDIPISGPDWRWSLSDYDNFVRTLGEQSSYFSDADAAGKAIARLAQQRPDAMRVLDAANVSGHEFFKTPEQGVRSLLTANQVAKKAGGRELVENLVQRNIPEPLVTARALLNEGLNPTQKELAVTFIQDGMDINDAIQAAKALA